MITSILVVSDALLLLFARHYGPDGTPVIRGAAGAVTGAGAGAGAGAGGAADAGTADAATRALAEAALEARVATALKREWHTGADGNLIAVITDDGSTCVVCKRLGGLAIVLTGTDDDDELALADLMPVIEDVLQDSTGGKTTPEALMANFGKLSVCIDDVVPTGHVYTTSSAMALKMSKLKPLPARS